MLLRFGAIERELCGGEPDTTNNRMEMTAAIRALEALNEACTVELFTDSVYLKNGITQWLANWRARGWKTANRKPVKNQDLWLELDEAAGRHEVTWHWVKGHSGHAENERADALANQGLEQCLDEA